MTVSEHFRTRRLDPSSNVRLEKLEPKPYQKLSVLAKKLLNNEKYGHCYDLVGLLTESTQKQLPRYALTNYLRMNEGLDNTVRGYNIYQVAHNSATSPCHIVCSNELFNFEKPNQLYMPINKPPVLPEVVQAMVDKLQTTHSSCLALAYRADGWVTSKKQAYARESNPNDPWVLVFKFDLRSSWMALAACQGYSRLQLFGDACELLNFAKIKK